MDVEIEQDDLNQKFLTSLASEWLIHTIVWRNRSDLDTMSLDDLYNHLKVYKSEVQKKFEPNSQNMAFISSAKHISGNEKVNVASVSTASTNISTASANIGVASISQDTTCANIASQSSGSQIKFEDIHQINEDDMKEMDIKWNMSLLSMRANRYWKKIRKKITIQGIDVAGFDKSKDWSYMENDKENHALVADEEAPTEFALMAKTNAESEARLAEHGNQELKYCEKIRVLEFKTESKLNCIESLTKDLELLKKEKGELENKLTGFQTASKDLDSHLESQRLDKNKEGLGYSDVPPPPPPTQVYSPPKKDMSWTGLPEFTADTITDYSRPSLAIESNTDDLQNRNPSVTENRASSSTILSKSAIKFVKAAERPTENKTDKVETVKKPIVQYAELYRKTSQKSNGSSQNNIDDKGYWDSCCSRHMTGNISYLSEYEPFDGGYVSFGQGGCKITGKGTIKTDKLEFENVYFMKDLKTPRQHNMYSIDLNNNVPHKDLTCLVAKASADEGMKWHRRLGHLNFKTMNRLVRYNLVRGLPSKCFENDHNYTACLKGKQHKASCKSKLANSMTKPLYTLHMDLFGPTSNGVAERRNRTLIEAARTMLADAKLPVTFWAEEVNTACYVQNRVLVNESHNKTPYELFNGRIPAIGFLKPFGCHVMILNTLDNLGKFEAKWDEGYFIGYSMSNKAFRVFNKRTKRVEENLHVDFLENKAIKKGAGPNWLFDIDSLTESMNYVSVVVAGTNSTNFSGTKDTARQEVKKDVSSLRYIAFPNRIHEVHLESSSSQPQETCNSDEPKSSGNFNPTATSTNPLTNQLETLTVETPIPTVSSPVPTACLNASPEPSSDTRLISKRVANQVEIPSLDNILTLTNQFEDILRVTTYSDESNGVEANVSNMETTITASPTPILKIHKDHPKSQIIGPMDTLIQTRNKSKETLVDCPKGVRSIGTKWVLKNKKDERGIFIKNKARLVAQGHTQEEGIDYDKVFAPVARIKAIRLFVAYASFMGFTVYRIDMKSAFLYGTINEEVYVMQPPEFQDLDYPARVYKVEKTIEFEAFMHEKFQMSAMGELNFFLGLQVLHKEDGIFLSQDKYVGDILKKFGYLDVRSSNTPMDKKNPWGKEGTRKDVDLHLYRSIIGSLMYLIASRPYIMFAVCACARHQVTPKECHLHVVKRIFRYLKGHPKLGLWYPKESPFDLVAYLDSDYGKFEAKRDEGYFLGYSMSSKAFRVFNKRTKRVEENLHIEFLENKAIEKGFGLNWLFDIDSLTKSMNYVPVVHDEHLESPSSQPQDACNTDAPKTSGNSNSTATSTNPPADQLETLTVETLILTVSSPFPTGCFTDSQEPSSETRLISKRVANQVETPSLDNILTLTNRFEDILGVTLNKEESNGVEADVSNMETTITARPTPTLRIHRDHPKSQIIGHVDTPIQTRNKSKEVGEQIFIATIHQKTDPALLQFCLFSCFLSQVEPKKISDALQDPIWSEGSDTPTEPHHTPSLEVQQTLPTTYSSPSLPPVTTVNIPPGIPTAALPTVVPTDSPQLRHYTRRARIAQSSALPLVADELASPLRDVSQGEACPTVSSLKAEQDMANIAKTSTLPSDSTPRVTSLAADKGSMQHKLDELTALCTSLLRQQLEMVTKFTAQELDINSLKARIKVLEDKDRGVAEQSGDDALIMGMKLDVGEEAAERVIPTGSDSIPTAGPPATGVPTAGPIFATATVVTPYTRRKGKEKMIESETPKKKKMMDIQMARQLEEEMEREAQRMNKQIARDAEIARIHAKEELSNETIAKYLQEYHQFATELPIERKIKLISDQVRYQDNYAKVHKYQSQQRKPLTKKQPREFYTLVLRNQAGWKRSYWKITRLGGSSASYQFFVDMLKHLDREDLNKLWRLVKESLSIRDEDIFGVNVQDDTSMFDADKDLQDEEVVVEEVNAANIATSVTAATITVVSFDELTLAQALVQIKTSNPKAKGIVMQEPKSDMPLKKKAQISLDEKYALSYKLKKMNKKGFSKKNLADCRDLLTSERLEDANESVELKRCLGIVPDEVTINATPLSVKTLIVDYKIYKEERKSFF
nr:putative ribonuclease H-like domain-containing protein [Tanacetum cinerariifolium]